MRVSPRAGRAPHSPVGHGDPPRRRQRTSPITYCLERKRIQASHCYRRRRHPSPAFYTCPLRPCAYAREWHSLSHMHRRGDMSAPVGLNRASGWCRWYLLMMPAARHIPRLGTTLTVQPRGARDKQVIWATRIRLVVERQYVAFVLVGSLDAASPSHAYVQYTAHYTAFCCLMAARAPGPVSRARGDQNACRHTQANGQSRW
jgi:hypothetical protein